VGDVALIVALVIAGVALVLVGILLAIARARNRRTGGSGFVQHSRVTCPHCGQSFDYTWIPGVSFTAVRLGPTRYMRCQICHRWGMFDVYGAPAPPTP
jgi:hypothetical protein